MLMYPKPKVSPEGGLSSYLNSDGIEIAIRACLKATVGKHFKKLLGVDEAVCLLVVAKLSSTPKSSDEARYEVLHERYCYPKGRCPNNDQAGSLSRLARTRLNVICGDTLEILIESDHVEESVLFCGSARQGSIIVVCAGNFDEGFCNSVAGVVAEGIIIDALKQIEKKRAPVHAQGQKK